MSFIWVSISHRQKIGIQSSKVTFQSACISDKITRFVNSYPPCLIVKYHRTSGKQAVWTLYFVNIRQKEFLSFFIRLRRVYCGSCLTFNIYSIQFPSIMTLFLHSTIEHPKNHFSVMVEYHKLIMIYSGKRINFPGSWGRRIFE